MTESRSHNLLLRLALTAAAAVVVSAGACPIDQNTLQPPNEPTPTTLAVVSGNSQQQTVGLELADPLVVRLDDQDGDPMAGETVTFAVTQGSGSVATASVQTDASGQASATWTLGITAGTGHQVTATVSGTSLSAVFSAQGNPDVPTTLNVFDGDGQQALVGNAVANVPAVQVRDQYGNGVPGVEVTFVVTVGGGSLTDPVDTTDVAGIARVGSWTLGSSGANAMTGTATTPGLTGNPGIFGATGLLTLFNIEVRFSDSGVTITSPQRQAFVNAAARWSAIIVGDLPSQAVAEAAGQCAGADHPALSETVDDVVIYVVAETIDGAFGTVGQGGPCRVRGSSNLPYLGGMRFDTADLVRLETNGDLEAVVMHEMGHVFGFGTLWNGLGFLQQPSDTAPAAIVDTYFNGATAIA
ncbi:MAG: Ig-like domain-containing protein, partial [Planctomycetota bacterium]